MIFWEVKLGKETVSLGGKLLNSAFIELYAETRLASLEFSNIFKLSMLCVILEIVCAISSSCLFKTARYLESILSRADFSFLTMLSISLCRSFFVCPKLLSTSQNWYWCYLSELKCRRQSLYILDKWIAQTLLNLFVLLASCFQCVSKTLLWSFKETHVAQLGMLHCTQWSSHIFEEFFDTLL